MTATRSVLSLLAAVFAACVLVAGPAVAASAQTDVAAGEPDDKPPAGVLMESQPPDVSTWMRSLEYDEVTTDDGELLDGLAWSAMWLSCDPTPDRAAWTVPTTVEVDPAYGTAYLWGPMEWPNNEVVDGGWEFAVVEDGGEPAGEHV